MQPNLRKTPRGGRRMAMIISTKVADDIFGLVFVCFRERESKREREYKKY